MAQIEHAPFCLDSLADYVEDGDDFWGDSLDARWDVGGEAGGSAAVVDGVDGGIVRLTTGATNLDTYAISWQNIRSLHVNKNAVLEVKARMPTTTAIYLVIELQYDPSNRIRMFRVGNWSIRCDKAGVSTTVDTGIAPDTDWHIIRVVTSPTAIRFYYDGVEVSGSPITTNIPDNVYLQPRVSVQTAADAAKYMDIDYVWWRQER